MKRLLGVLLLLSLFTRYGRLAAALATVIAGWQVVWLLPFTANHSGLLLLALGLFAALSIRTIPRKRRCCCRRCAG